MYFPPFTFLLSLLPSSLPLSLLPSDTGEVVTTGDNAYKQLGYQKEKGDREPGVVTALADRAVRKLACGDFFTIVATEGEGEGG